MHSIVQGTDGDDNNADEDNGDRDGASRKKKRKEGDEETKWEKALEKRLF